MSFPAPLFSSATQTAETKGRQATQPALDSPVRAFVDLKAIKRNVHAWHRFAFSPARNGVVSPTIISHVLIALSRCLKVGGFNLPQQ